MYYYLAKSEKASVSRIAGIPEDVPERFYKAVCNTEEVLEYYMLGLMVCESFTRLERWNSSTERFFGDYLIRDLHTAEKLCRDFLFEFRTCLDHMETKIKRKYGEESELWKLFKQKTGEAYDNCKEYGFTFHLRNSSQHCATIVHGFNGSTGLGISSSKSQLIKDHKGWNRYDRAFFQTVDENIDLLTVFRKAYEAFNKALAPIVQYLLEQESVKSDLLLLRKWGDWFTESFQEDVHSFHVFTSQSPDGTPVCMEGDVPIDTGWTFLAIDWDAIYGITNSKRL